MIDVELLHTKQLEIMDAIHKVCCDNHITYYLIGGSCLGAIRHKGFIPWDPDIDIAMPRKDYERFFSNVKSRLPNNLQAHTYKTDYFYIKPHGLVCMKDTILYTESEQDNLQIPNFGVYIDVFPLDKCPENKQLQLKHAKDYLRIKKLKKYKFSFIYKQNSLVKKMLKYLIRCFMWPISIRFINDRQQKIMTRYLELESCNLWCSIASKYKYEKQLMPKYYYGTPQLAKFEDREFYIPEMPEKYLTQIYGDYMKLPPKDEQNKLLNYFTKLEIK